MPTLTQQIRFCASPDGARIAYATSGSGPPLVKVSNWLSHLEFDWQSPVWMHLLQELASGHTLVRYDERGCGWSDWDAELSFEHWVRDLEAVVDGCGLECFPLLGISQGASIAIAYAVRHPERVTHLILHGGYARGRRYSSQSASPKEEADVMTGSPKSAGASTIHNPAFRQFFTTQFIPGGSPEQHQWFNDLERISTSPRNAGQFMRIFSEIDVVALSKLACPTLVFHGVEDARVPFEEGRFIATHIPDARFVQLETQNHLPLENEPAWQRWMDEFRAFLPATSAGMAQFDALTRRERELVELIAQGRNNLQIATQLGLSGKTVRNHVTNIFAKLDVENRAQAIVLARNAGLGTRRP
jgi:pimeloyl-ACP methyl ester carboxylesterase/DNA-binding CsgD family transcriptional regulator